MEKSLSDIIREQVIQLKHNVRLTRCRPVILSQWGEIEAALNAAWPLRTIWKTLHEEGKYPGTYESFRTNVREIQRNGPIAKSKEQQKAPEEKAHKTEKKARLNPATLNKTRLSPQKTGALRVRNGNPARQATNHFFKEITYGPCSLFLESQRRNRQIDLQLHHGSIPYGEGVQDYLYRCDPATPTLIAYEALHAHRLDIMDGNNIEKTKFDTFVELIMAGEEDEHFIIDNGTSSLVALSDYLLANDIVGLLSSMGHFVTFHVIVVGGDNLKGTTE